MTKCSFTVTNNLPIKLEFSTSAISNGKITSNSPKEIEANKSTTIKFEDDGKGKGVKLTLVYSLKPESMDSLKWTTVYDRPSKGSVKVTDSVDVAPILFKRTTGTDKDGNGLASIKYTTDMVTSIQVTKVLVSVKPIVPIRNTKDVVIPDTKDLEIWTSATAESVKDNTTENVTGSFKPFAVSVESSSISLKAQLSGDNNMKKIPFYLTGKAHGKEVIKRDKTCFQDDAVPVSYEVLNDKAKGIPWGNALDIAWYLTCIPSKQVIFMNKSRVEAYGVSTSLPSFFNTKGIPVEFLRYFAEHEFTQGYVKWVTSECMRFGFKYDCNKGGASFTTGVTDDYKLNYKLKNWLKEASEPKSRINCYDQASLVQLAMMLQLGNPSKPWAFMCPFGYMNKTPLVGWGDCNNPFFKDDTTRKVVSVNDTNRTGFGNHAFVVLSSKVLDSCCGPHQGTETKSEYVTAAVDTTTTLNDCTAGTEDDIKFYPGVVDLNQTSSSSAKSAAMIGPRHLREAIDRAMGKAIVSNPPPVEHSNADFETIPALLQRGFSAHLASESIALGPEGSESRYIFDLAPEGFILNINVCKDHESAIKVMMGQLATYQAPLDEVFSRPVAGREKGQLNLEGSRTSMWIRGNMFFVLDVLCPGPDAHTLAKAVDDHFAALSVQPPASFRPRILELRGPSGSVKIGTEFTVEAVVDDVGEMNAEVKHGNILVLSANNNTHKFRLLARRHGAEEITFTFSHLQTRSVVSESMEITVIGEEEEGDEGEEHGE